MLRWERFLVVLAPFQTKPKENKNKILYVRVPVVDGKKKDTSATHSEEAFWLLLLLQNS